MADRYQNRPYPADDDYDSDDDRHAPANGESDPLAELARLIGQTDPFAMGRANQQVQPRSAAREQYQQPAAPDDEPLASPPPWVQRATPQPEAAPEDYPGPVHPLRRYATPLAAPAPDYDEAPLDEAEQEPDPSRYDEALYGQLDTGAEEPEHDPAYLDDSYAYQDGEEPEEPVRKRGGAMVTVVMVLALAVVGTGAAFAYRTYVTAPRSGEPPIIKADNSPTKIVPAPADASAKVADRMASGDGTEKIVPREETPVDLNAKSGPRVVLPPLNPNPNPPPAVNAAPAFPPPPNVPNGTLANSEPHKIKTLAVRGDQPDAAAMPVTPAPAAAKPAPAVRTSAPRNPPSSANASANAPLSLSPEAPQTAPAASEARTRVANAPAQTAPAQTAPAPGSGGGSYLVQVSSQRNEADAQASYKALQAKFPTVLGSHAPVIKRADLGEKGTYYRAMVGPFGTPEEASQFCGSLKTAGGQCVVQKN